MRSLIGVVAAIAFAGIITGCAAGASTGPSGSGGASAGGSPSAIGSPSAGATASTGASPSTATSLGPSADPSVDDSLAPLTPIAGYEITIDWKETWGTGVADIGFFVGRADTAAPDVTGNARFLTGTGTVDGYRAGWASCSPDIDAPEGKDAKAEFTATIVGDTVTIAAWAAYDTPLAGLATAPLTVAVAGGEFFPDGATTNGCGTSRWEATLFLTPF
jgi:hypothetical protein